MAIVINGSGTVTGISVGGLPDGIVDAGTLATNSVDSAELIDGSIDTAHIAADQITGAILPTGSVIQTLYVQPTSHSSTTGVTPDNFADTVYTLAITPSATSSKILVSATFAGRVSGAARSCGAMQLLRDSTVITGSGGEIFQIREIGGAYEWNYMAGIAWVDSPSSTSAITYKIQHAVGESGGSLIYTYGNTGGFTGSMVLQEIAG